MIECTLTKIFTIFQVMLYHIIRHKWKITTYSLLTAEIITFITSLLSSDIASYSGIMAVLAFSGIGAAVKLGISEQ